MRKNVSAVMILLTLTTLGAVFCTDNKQSGKDDAAYNDSLQQSIARGDYLVNAVAACFDCHSDRDFSEFAGPVVEGTEGRGGFKMDHKLVSAIPGVLYAKNITPDTATGIGGWTDDEVFRALTLGISKNGDTLFPLMPYPHFNKLPKQDILDIIAYIRTIKPVNNPVPPRELFIPISMAYPPNLATSPDANKRPDESDKITYGEYLVSIADCGGCHTPMNEKGQPGAALSGGLTFNFPGFTVNSANLTPDSVTGIGAWTEKMFLAKFNTYRTREGYAYDAGKKNSAMPWTIFAKMKDSDLTAIYAYLHSLQPVKNKIEKWPGQPAAP